MQKSENLIQALSPGDIILSQNDQIYPPKKKLSLCLSAEERWFFLINSKDNYSFSLPIKKEDYDFLDHDSFVCCKDVFLYEDAQVEYALEEYGVLGRISDDFINRVVKFLSSVKTLPEVDKQVIRSSLKSVLVCNQG